MKSTKETSNLFSTIVNSQKEIFDNFLTASNKVKEGIEKANTSVDAVSIYKDWASNQEKIAEKMVADAKKEMKFEEMPEAIKEFVSTQEKFTKNCVDYVKSASEKVSDSKILNTYKESTEKMYEQMNKNYNEMFEQVSKFQPLNTTTFFQDIFSKESFDKTMDMWKQMIPAVK